MLDRVTISKARPEEDSLMWKQVLRGQGFGEKVYWLCCRFEHETCGDNCGSVEAGQGLKVSWREVPKEEKAGATDWRRRVRCAEEGADTLRKVNLAEDGDV